LYPLLWLGGRGCCSPSLQFLTDELRVRQIIMNGLTNAVKYSNAPVNGPIAVVVSARDDADATLADSPATLSAVSIHPAPEFICFDVLDRGPGLGGLSDDVFFADFLAPVTSVAATSHSKSTIHVGSSGVGLPICSRYAPPLRRPRARWIRAQ
jgi:hypothetical protein